jgi:hypothetical protein
MEKKVKIRLNSTDKVEELLQEIYDQACRQLVSVQNEMNKLITSTNLANEPVDSKAKYAKAMHDYHGDYNRALSTKVELVKFMGEIIKHNGDIEDALNDQQFAKATKLDLNQLRAEISGDGEDTDSYDLKN